MKCLIPALLLGVQALAAQDNGGAIQIGRGHYLEGLRQEVRELKQKAFEEEERFGRLMRLKIHWDLLLPVREEDLFEGTTLPSKSREDLAAQLAEEIRKEVSLKSRVRRSGGIETETPLPMIQGTGILPDPAPGPVAKKMPAVRPLPKPDSKEPPSAAKAKPPDARAPFFGPLRSQPAVAGPTLARSEALTPFGSGRGLTNLTPSTFTSKRIRALIGAGMATEALAVIGARLQMLEDKKQDPPPALLFLEAKTLESLGELDKAKTFYGKVADVDRGTNAEGKEVLGIWAKSANFALEHLRWLEANSDYTPPDIEPLK